MHNLLLLIQNEQQSTEDTAFKKQDKKDAKEGTSSAGNSKDDKAKGKNYFLTF